MQRCSWSRWRKVLWNNRLCLCYDRNSFSIKRELRSHRVRLTNILLRVRHWIRWAIGLSIKLSRTKIKPNEKKENIQTKIYKRKYWLDVKYQEIRNETEKKTEIEERNSRLACLSFSCSAHIICKVRSWRKQTKHNFPDIGL